MTVTPALRRWRQADSWSTLARLVKLVSPGFRRRQKFKWRAVEEDV